MNGKRWLEKEKNGGCGVGWSCHGCNTNKLKPVGPGPATRFCCELGVLLSSSPGPAYFRLCIVIYRTPAWEILTFKRFLEQGRIYWCAMFRLHFAYGALPSHTQARRLAKEPARNHPLVRSSYLIALLQEDYTSRLTVGSPVLG